MPVSYLPCCAPLLLILILPVSFAINRKLGATISAATILFVISFLLTVYIPGWRLHRKAAQGDPISQYYYAQWIETHHVDTDSIFLFSPEPDTENGFAWLEKSADQNYGPAVWLVGVRLKYGIDTPRPPNWTGPPSNNSFPQVEKGQFFIDHAVKDLHFTPPPFSERDGVKLYYKQRVP